MDLRQFVGTFLGMSLALILNASAAHAMETPGSQDFQQGCRYYAGDGLPANYLKAAEHFAAAAKAGNLHARYMMALLSKRGDGVARDEVTARAHFLTLVEPMRRAAAEGDVVAQRMLALMYQDGDGVDHNLEQARQYFSLAAGQGDSHSQLQLARYYARGMGVKPDGPLAQRWYEQAASRGNADAQFELALFLLQGEPTLAEREQALGWLAAAARQRCPGVHAIPPKFDLRVMLEDTGREGRLAPGEEGRVHIFLKNLGGPARDVRLFIERSTPEVCADSEQGRPLGDLLPGEWVESVLPIRLPVDLKGPADIQFQTVITEARAEFETRPVMVLHWGDE
ncbi:MAG: tetratricopeptide repeat protein [Candidatus Sericytochromatia bacterium]|nr:tetratricopeptide repeat protein [Candidatus Sericytochromatia bacterium]